MNTPATMPTIQASTVTMSAAEALRSTQCSRYQSTICTKPEAVNTIEKNIPLANHEVFQALVNGGIARQKFRFLPRYKKCSGSLKSTISAQPSTVAHQAHVVISLMPASRPTRYVPMPSAEKTSASQTSMPLPEIHSVWRMGLTIHSCVTIHWRRVCAFTTSPPHLPCRGRRCAGRRRGPRS